MKNKRRYIYEKLSKLNKALESPSANLIDPIKFKLRKKKDNAKRIRKKIKKSRETFSNKHQKKCINCKKRGHLVENCS